MRLFGCWRGPVESSLGAAQGNYLLLPVVKEEKERQDPQQACRDLQPRLKIPFCDIKFHELIGKGSFKQVYRGVWLNTTVAIVAMRRGGLLTEARLLQQLGAHPNLVQFYRWSTDAHGNEYIIVELVPYGSLDKVLASHGPSLRNRSKLMMCEQICHAMVELAAEGVAHRDLAARNILVQSIQPVHVKVSDFGLARVAPPELDVGLRGSEDHSSSGGGIEASSGGSPAERDAGGRGGEGRPPAGKGGGGGQDPSLVPVRWSAPEVLQGGGGWSEKSDVYSYGCTMWEIFSNGAEPYASRSDREAVAAVLRGELLPRPRNCPQPVYALMADCWRLLPRDRPSFAQIAEVYRRWREAAVATKAAAAAAGATAAGGGGAPPTTPAPAGGGGHRSPVVAPSTGYVSVAAPWDQGGSSAPPPAPAGGGGHRTPVVAPTTGYVSVAAPWDLQAQPHPPHPQHPHQKPPRPSPEPRTVGQLTSIPSGAVLAAEVAAASAPGNPATAVAAPHAAAGGPAAFPWSTSVTDSTEDADAVQEAAAESAAGGAAQQAARAAAALAAAAVAVSVAAALPGSGSLQGGPAVGAAAATGAGAAAAEADPRRAVSPCCEAKLCTGACGGAAAHAQRWGGGCPAAGGAAAVPALPQAAAGAGLAADRGGSLQSGRGPGPPRSEYGTDGGAAAASDRTPRVLGDLQQLDVMADGGGGGGGGGGGAQPGGAYGGGGRGGGGGGGGSGGPGGRLLGSTLVETCCVMSMEVETAIDPLMSCSTIASTFTPLASATMGPAGAAAAAAHGQHGRGRAWSGEPGAGPGGRGTGGGSALWERSERAQGGGAGGSKQRPRRSRSRSGMSSGEQALASLGHNLLREGVKGFRVVESTPQPSDEGMALIGFQSPRRSSPYRASPPADSGDGPALTAWRGRGSDPGQMDRAAGQPPAPEAAAADAHVAAPRPSAAHSPYLSIRMV